MQGPTLPVLDLNFMPIIKEGMLVTDELCAQYRVLGREIQILQEENIRLRRMPKLLLGPRMILPPPPKEQFVIGIGIPLACSKLGGVLRYHIIIF
jgi:hypothetical protein